MAFMGPFFSSFLFYSVTLFFLFLCFFYAVALEIWENKEWEGLNDCNEIPNGGFFGRGGGGKGKGMGL